MEDWQSAARVSLSSVATYTMHVRGCYSWVADTGHLETDPARGLTMPFIPPRPPRPIPEKELKLACAEESIVTWLQLAGWMGLRAMEISGITREAIVEVDGDLVISGMGKNQRLFTLPVPDRLAPYLRAHLTRNGPLWCDGAGDPITAYAVSKITNRFLRHRFGTRLHQATRISRRPAISCLTTTLFYVQTGGQREVTALNTLAEDLPEGTDGHRSRQGVWVGPTPQRADPFEFY